MKIERKIIQHYLIAVLFILIKKESDGYHIDLVGAIKKQLHDVGITNIEISPIDTAKNPNYYSHTNEKKDLQKEGGQNFVGFYYK